MQNFTGIFSFEEVKQTFENNRRACRIISEDLDNCPAPLSCYLHSCYLKFKCLRDDLSKCSIETDQCEKDGDCLSNLCEDNKCVNDYVECLSGMGSSHCGNTLGQPCNSNSDCVYENCKEGICIHPEVLDKKMFIYPLTVFIVASIIMLLFCCCFCILFKRKRTKK